jgi:hypothetical protein
MNKVEESKESERVRLKFEEAAKGEPANVVFATAFALAMHLGKGELGYSRNMVRDLVDGVWGKV